MPVDEGEPGTGVKAPVLELTVNATIWPGSVSDHCATYKYLPVEEKANRTPPNRLAERNDAFSGVSALPSTGIVQIPPALRSATNTHLPEG